MTYGYPRHSEPPYPDVATHMPVLWTVLTEQSPMEVYEYGAGKYSTALLGAWTMAKGALLVTGENDPAWIPRPRHDRHVVTGTYDAVPKRAQSNSVAFVDCEGDLRAPLINEIFECTVIGTLVAHDTEPLLDRSYGMRKPLCRWPYGLSVKCPFHGVHTTVVSREPMGTLGEALKSLSDNAGLHAIRWGELQALIKSFKT